MPKFKKATVTLKTEIWDNTKKIPEGTTFVDKECFEGKYRSHIADVVFEEETSKQKSGDKEKDKEKEKNPNKNDLSNILNK